MRTTDGPGFILDVLKNILENGKTDKNGNIEYELGNIAGLSDLAEQAILKHLQKEKVLFIEKINPSGSIGYNQSAVIYSIMPKNLSGESEPSVTVSTNRPAIAILKYKKENLLKEIVKHQKELVSKIGKHSKAITQDSNGDLKYFGDLITTKNNKPLDHDTLHFKIVCILLNKGGQEGKVSLHLMESELKKLGVRFENENRTSKETIDDAITNFFRRATINKNILKNRLPDNRPIITTYRKGRRFAGWQLNNPEV